MRFRVLITVATLAFACRSTLAEAKAYEVVKYKGKAEGITFALDFADGYIDASEMRVTERRAKTTRFDLAGSEEMRFVPRKPSGPKREIVLKMSVDDGPVDTIQGTYTVDSLQIQFTLRRID
jgi:hypothetical protein